MIDPLPSLDRTSPTFRSQVDTFFGSQLPAFSSQAEAARVEINSNTVAAASSATTAVNSAANAATAAEIAMGATNFKGLWSSLSGALNKPATVKHNDRFWLLLTNLANVALSEPSNSNPNWTTLDSGTEVTQQILNDTAAVPGVVYIFADSSAKLTLPATGTLVKGDFIGVRATAPFSVTQLVKFNGAKWFAQTVTSDEIYMDVPAINLTWEDTTIGYI